MKTVGLFEAKAKLSEICALVQSRGQTVVITKRGVPFVQITPIQLARNKSIWDLAKRYRTSLPSDSEFTPPRRVKTDFKKWYED